MSTILEAIYSRLDYEMAVWWDELDWDECDEMDALMAEFESGNLAV